MDSHQNKQLVMRAYELYARGDIKGVLGLCAYGVCWTSVDIEHVPFSGVFNGRFQVGEFFASLAAAMDTLRFTPRDFIAEGDKVVVTGEARWHVKSTGVEFESEWVHVFTVREAEVVRFEQFTDTAAAQAAFKATAQPGRRAKELRH